MKKLLMLVLLIFSLSFILGCGILAEDGNDDFSCDGPPPPPNGNSYVDFSKAVFVVSGQTYTSPYGMSTTWHTSLVFTPNMKVSYRYSTQDRMITLNGTWRLVQYDPVKIVFIVYYPPEIAQFDPTLTYDIRYQSVVGYVTFDKNKGATITIPITNGILTGTWSLE